MGTAIICSGDCSVRAFEHGHRLQHKYIENLHHGSEVGKLLHGVALDPLLRPRLSESLGPPPAGLFLVQLEELRLGWGVEGGRGLPDLGRAVLSFTSFPLLALGQNGGLSRPEALRRLAFHTARTWRKRRCRRLIEAPAACATQGFAGSDRGPRIVRMKLFPKQLLKKGNTVRETA